MALDKYEISLWEDKMVGGDSPSAHFEEQKIVIIGSNTMTAACRAYEPRLVENINGTHTLTFKMYYIYTDEQTGEKRTNPYLNLLVNERKVKAYWKEQWYDLVVKNIQEDSSGKSITYTCQDLFITELAKNGYNLEFDNELQNNQGTIVELGERILEGTEWQLDVNGSDLVKQEKEEPLYEATSKAVTTITNDKTGVTTNLPAGKRIFIFYSSVLNKTSPCQFLYDPTDEYKRDTNSQLIIDVPCYSVETTWTESEGHPPRPTNLASSMEDNVSTEYRGSRLVNSQKTVLDPVTDKYVQVYRANRDGNGYSGPEHSIEEDGKGDVIYAYESTEYKDPTFVNNLLINNKNFAGLDGWIGPSGSVGPFQLYPEYTGDDVQLDNYTAQSYLHFIANNNIYNTGLRDSGSYIPDGIQAGEKYVFRYKAQTNNNNKPSGNPATNVFIPHIYKYSYNNGQVVPTLVDYLTSTTETSSDGWRECICTCITSFSRNQVYMENIGFFIHTNSECWAEQIEFFPYVMGEINITAVQFNANKTLYYTRNAAGQYIRCTNNSEYSSTTIYYKRINPGEMDISSVATTYYHYYNHTTHSGTVTIDDYLYVGTEDWPDKSNLTAENNNFNKIRSITAKQSNRFNLLQTLAETFECWCQFDIKHYGDPGYPTTETINNQTVSHTPGQVVYEDGKPLKFVRFKEKIGQQVGFGFIYSIDLKSISRTIQSDQIVTKTIVSANSNEFATDGFCTIARSPENYSRDTAIYNFDYFITRQLLDGAQLTRDLYSWFEWEDSSGDSHGSSGEGYYTQLRNLNLEFDEITDLLVQKKTELTKQESYKTVYENYITSLQNEQTNLETSIMQLANVTSWRAAKAYIKKNPDMQEIVTRMNARQNCLHNLEMYQNMLDGLATSITKLTDVIDTKTTRQKTISNNLKELNWAFFRKYSRFIQEGTWINEDYIDDTLYFLDAQSVAYTSSRPQISYNINVARLSSLDEFKSKVFHLGDISYVQDVEFFGYLKDDPSTPYKEQVLISEITSNFDDPVQDVITVQNYKTQFEDLFQRITATTQSLQYATGEYNRAASIVDTNGNIKPETLQSSINYNNNLVIQSNNEQIFQDSTGITVTDATNPNNRTKITSGGVFISTDGGVNWKNAIRADGIATEYLTAGNINTQEITLLDGEYQAFRWDSTGINAYYELKDDQGHTAGVNLGKFVRFDHYGVYGINGLLEGEDTYNPDDYDPTKFDSGEDYIWDRASFGMTWNGFFLKNNYYNSADPTQLQYQIEISSTDDIRFMQKVGNNLHERLKIGKLAENMFGFRITDNNEQVVLTTLSDGTLWLKDKLYIGTSLDSGYQVSLGYLPLVTNEANQIHYSASGSPINLDTREIVEGQEALIHRSIDLNNKFVVWEDGTMYAKDGYFEGTINATDGNFSGNVNASGVFTGELHAATGWVDGQLHIGGESGITLGSIVPAVYQVRITSTGGVIFADGHINTTLTAGLYYGNTPITTGVTYQWYKDGTMMPSATSAQLSVNLYTSTATYRCHIVYQEQQGGE